MKKILLIEDSVQMQKYVSNFLVEQDYDVKVIEDYDNILEEVQEFNPNLILLDINLPKYDGFFYLKLIKKKFKVPVIILSARSDESEQIRGIENGANDYITKPFSINILLAKINALFERESESSTVSEINVNGLCLDSNLLRANYNDNVVELTKNEFKILALLMANNNQIVSRNSLLEHLWDDSVFVDDNTLTVNITRVKKKLADLGLIDVIQNKRGVGYKICL